MNADSHKQNLIELPESFEPPVEVAWEQYVLEVLSPKHNDIDYDAWNSSIDELQGIFGPYSDWPTKNYTKDQNLSDLEEHYKEFEEKTGFTYTILSTDKQLCLGCVYVLPTPAKDYDVGVYYWFRNSHKHLEELFQDELQHWLEHDWQLSFIAFPGRTMSWEEYDRLIKAVKDT